MHRIFHKKGNSISTTTPSSTRMPTSAQSTPMAGHHRTRSATPEVRAAPRKITKPLGRFRPAPAPLPDPTPLPDPYLEREAALNNPAKPFFASIEDGYLDRVPSGVPPNIPPHNVYGRHVVQSRNETLPARRPQRPAQPQPQPATVSGRPSKPAAPAISAERASKPPLTSRHKAIHRNHMSDSAAQFLTPSRSAPRPDSPRPLDVGGKPRTVRVTGTLNAPKPKAFQRPEPVQGRQESVYMDAAGGWSSRLTRDTPRESRTKPRESRDVVPEGFTLGRNTGRKESAATVVTRASSNVLPPDHLHSSTRAPRVQFAPPVHSLPTKNHKCVRGPFVPPDPLPPRETNHYIDHNWDSLVALYQKKCIPPPDNIDHRFCMLPSRLEDMNSKQRDTLYDILRPFILDDCRKWMMFQGDLRHGYSAIATYDRCIEDIVNFEPGIPTIRAQRLALDKVMIAVEDLHYDNLEIDPPEYKNVYREVIFAVEQKQQEKLEAARKGNKRHYVRHAAVIVPPGTKLDGPAPRPLSHF